MPLKYDSMPKITFCFKDYLEELRKIIFALQVLPVLETFTGLPDVLFLSVNAYIKRKQKENSPWIRDATTKKTKTKNPTFIS